MEKIPIGTLGEKVAGKFLLQKGFTILEKNYSIHCGKRIGEIDIIAKKNNTIHFIEVKTRTHHPDGNPPEQAINREKLMKIQKVALCYIKSNDSWNIPHQFDSISIIVENKSKIASIRYLKNIFL